MADPIYSPEYHVAHLAFARADIVEAAANRQPILDRLRAYTADVVKAERDRHRGALDLLEALGVYVGHRDDCDVLSGAPECSCGFDELYTRVRALVRAAQTDQTSR